jgi:hypothetical protein
MERWDANASFGDCKAWPGSDLDEGVQQTTVLAGLRDRMTIK